MNTISGLAWANVKKDRVRSILIAISILLTTLLLTAVSGVGYGMIRMNKSNAADYYGEFYGSFKNLTAQQVTEAARRAEISQLGITTRYAEVESRKELSLGWLDQTARMLSHMEEVFVEGHYPEAENEIAAAPAFFRELGIEQPQLGDTVVVRFRTSLKAVYTPQEFVICGLLQSAAYEANSMSAYTSQQHFEKNVAETDKRYTVLFQLDKSVPITRDTAKTVIGKLAANCGISDEMVSLNKNYLNWILDPGTETIVVCAVACMLVVLFSVVVIYNIFQVGIVQKVQEYGKLKAVGATRRQMRQVVLQEGMYLACISVPLGLLAGIGVANGVLAYMAYDLNTRGYALQMRAMELVSVPLLVLSALLAFATVWLALKKPMRMVASISPVEAMRYQEGGKCAGFRKGKRSMCVVSLTFANLSSHRKRTVSTIISMGLSCVLFVVFASLLGNMDAEYEARTQIPYGQFQIQLNYDLADEAYPENNLNHILENNPLDEKLIQKIKTIPGVTDVRTRSIVYAKQLDTQGIETGEAYGILVLDRDDFDRRVERDELSGLDYDQMSAEAGVCYGYEYGMAASGFAVGGTYHFQLYDGVVEKEWRPKMLASFAYVGADMAMTRDTYEQLGFTGEANHDIWVDCDAKDTALVKEALEALTGDMEHVLMDSYQNLLEITVGSIRLLKLPVYLLCMIIAFISFMNLTNTMITSIVTRKQEFGVLQAVGMTDSQLGRSLQLEGIFFSAGTAAVSLAVGIPLGYALFRYGKAQVFIGIGRYHFPLREVVFLFLFIAAMQMLLSFVLSRTVKKESIVERIRYQG